jgi:hypothetical protein
LREVLGVEQAVDVSLQEQQLQDNQEGLLRQPVPFKRPLVPQEMRNRKARDAGQGSRVSPAFNWPIRRSIRWRVRG